MRSTLITSVTIERSEGRRAMGKTLLARIFGSFMFIGIVAFIFVEIGWELIRIVLGVCGGVLYLMLMVKLLLYEE